MSYIASWSGGKDSCLACYKAMLEGHKICFLANFISDEYQRVRFHGTEAKLIQLQSESLGISLLQKATSSQGYEHEFKEAIRGLANKNTTSMIFGDIYIPQNRQWVERVCSEIGIEAILPLWARKAEELLYEFIEAGFKSVIVSARHDLIAKQWVGREIDKKFLNYLKDKNIDLCGENGEYHTLVVDGPIFDKRIEITESSVIKRESHWFLDTHKYCLAGEFPDTI